MTSAAPPRRRASMRTVRARLPRLPRRTVRLRLTLLYGSLFLVSGIALLILINVLVRQATGNLVVLREPLDGSTTVITTQPEERSEQSYTAMVTLLEAQAAEFRDAAAAQRDATRRQLLIQSGVALIVMAVASIGLGWFVAGRVLRPLRTITATARDISATNLHQRLALSGPDDELKELGDTIDGLLGRLERAFEAQRRFVANASHELRTPLARQRTLIEVALTDPEATLESMRDGYQRVLASGEEQERLIEALLTLARSERGLERQESFDLPALVDDVLTGMRPELKRRGIRLEHSLEPARAAGDPALVERLVNNLIDNAARHNTERGSVTVTTGVQYGRATLLVSNTGPSVAEEEIQRLFQPFRRVGQDRVGRAERHGLGLSIVQAIASAHGATVRASARPEGGLDVEVAFPAAGE